MSKAYTTTSRNIAMSTLVLFTTTLAGQSSPIPAAGEVRSLAEVEQPSAIARRGFVSVPGSPRLCDPAQVSAVQSARKRGGLVILAGIVITSLSASSAKSQYALIFGGAAVASYGGYMRYYASGADELWLSTIRSVAVGSTTQAEITDCIGKPNSLSTTGSTEVGMWSSSKPSFFVNGGGTGRVAQISFTKGVVATVTRAATTQE